MDEKYIENSIAESINTIMDFCFEHKECGGCPLYDSVKKYVSFNQCRLVGISQKEKETITFLSKG